MTQKAWTETDIIMYTTIVLLMFSGMKAWTETDVIFYDHMNTLTETDIIL